MWNFTVLSVTNSFSAMEGVVSFSNNNVSISFSLGDSSYCSVNFSKRFSSSLCGSSTGVNWVW